jgi:hypothetical protein
VVPLGDEALDKLADTLPEASLRPKTSILPTPG